MNTRSWRSTLRHIMTAAFVSALVLWPPRASAGEREDGPYFGQSPPGNQPSVFALGVVSLPDRYEYVIAFAPDGKQSCFGVTNFDWSTCDLFCARLEEGIWSKPERASFQGEGDAWLPYFAPDGKSLYFSSGRPDIARGANAWVTTRGAKGWGRPRKLGEPINSKAMDWRPVVVADGTVYFASNRGEAEENMEIYRSVPVAGAYRTAQKLPPPINSPFLDASPFVTLDGKTLIFESWRPGGYGQGDLYISHRRADGSFSEPANLGPGINTEQIEDGPYVSADGEYLFFNRRAGWVTQEQTDIWWVDLREIERATRAES